MTSPTDPRASRPLEELDPSHGSERADALRLEGTSDAVANAADEPSDLDETDAANPTDDADDEQEQPLRLTPGWIAVGALAVALGLAMGFIMSSVWLVR